MPDPTDDRPRRRPRDTTQPAPDLEDGILAEGSDTAQPTTETTRTERRRRPRPSND